MRQHTLYTNKDADRPVVICDALGSVVLGLCKVCGRAEAELEGPCPGSPEEILIREQAEGLVANAARLGVVVSIEQRPLRPLAMGNHETVVSVRSARKAA